MKWLRSSLLMCCLLVTLTVIVTVITMPSRTRMMRSSASEAYNCTHFTQHSFITVCWTTTLVDSHLHLHLSWFATYLSFGCPQGRPRNTKYVSFLRNFFDYSQLESFIIFERFKTAVQYQRRNIARDKQQPKERISTLYLQRRIQEVGRIELFVEHLNDFADYYLSHSREQTLGVFLSVSLSAPLRSHFSTDLHKTWHTPFWCPIRENWFGWDRNQKISSPILP